MILIPFFWNTSDENWIHFGVFLCSGGRLFWSVEDTDTDDQIRAMLEENGFPVTEIRRTAVGTFVEIDHEKIKLSNFYMWSEIDPKTSEEDVWRTYKIPVALWSDPVFKEHWWRTSGVLPLSEGFADIVKKEG